MPPNVSVGFLLSVSIYGNFWLYKYLSFSYQNWLNIVFCCCFFSFCGCFVLFFHDLDMKIFS